MVKRQSQVNFPVPDTVGTEWRKLCKQYDLAYGEDLAGLLLAASFFPARAHGTFKALAFDEYPPALRKAALELMEQVRRSMNEIFGEATGTQRGKSKS